VWEVLNDFGDIYKWSPGVTASELTSEGAVAEGSTRHCDFAPFGGVNERIERHANAQGIAGLAKGLQIESERIHAA